MFNPNKVSENQEQGKVLEKLLFSSLNQKDILKFVKDGLLFRSKIIANKLNIYIDELLISQNRKMDEEIYRKIIHQSEYLHLNWYKYIKENQPGSDPSEPRARFAYDLFNEVAENINIKDEGGVTDYSRLKFYTAIGSAPDYHESLDCFFEMYDIDENGNYVKSSEALIDFTISNNKSFDKQEIILLMDKEDATQIEYYLTFESKQNPKLKNNLYDKYIKSFSKQISDKLRENAEKVKKNKEYLFRT